MKYRLAVIVILLFVIGTPISIYAQQTKSLPEGMKPYVPTRLEWLSMELNANYRVEMSELEGYDLGFIPIENENTILIYVSYTGKTNREAMNRGIDSARRFTERAGKHRGWNSWLKVKEEIHLIDRTK